MEFHIDEEDIINKNKKEISETYFSSTSAITNNLLRAKCEDIVKAWFCCVNDGLYLSFPDNILYLSSRKIKIFG